jgi:predicted O-linked N-acetylglucosamine transferase (SPINDLY family)
VRIGYFSADFGRHAVAYLIAELIERHDRERFEVHGFALKAAASDDPMRARLAQAFDHFHEIDARTDAQAVDLARSLGLDIAVDLGGHTRGARTALFSQRLAPVQVNFLGFPGTMGADFIDYIIADEVTLPQASWPHCAEKVVQLPECFQPSDTRKNLPEADPPRRAFGLPDEGFVFCCFNNTYKINPDVFESWIRILGAVEGSCLWLLAEGEPVRSRLRAEAARAGVATERLVFGGRLPLAEYLGRYRLAGLFLDTLPFNAGTTANDALFAGLPVLTELGSSFCGRMAASLLRALDLPELIARSRAEYEAAAIRLARDPVELAGIRDRLWRNRAAGSLYDMARYTRHLEAAYAQMQRRRLSGLAPDHIAVQRKG